MISVVALVRGKPGAAERVRIGLKSLISPTRAETGNIIYVIHESEDPNLFVSYRAVGLARSTPKPYADAVCNGVYCALRRRFRGSARASHPYALSKRSRHHQLSRRRIMGGVS